MTSFRHLFHGRLSVGDETVKVLTAGEMADLDRMASDQYGVPSLTLMENAGRGVADLAVEMIGDVGGRPISIVCGKGNNGGDGLVAARHLLRRGARPRVFLLGKVQDLKDDARANFDSATRSGIEIRVLTGTADLDILRVESHGSALVIDALLGTGFTPPARGPYGDAIAIINAVSAPVLAVDLPSGLSADSGSAPAVSVVADGTVTFGLPKVGQFLHPAAARYGKLYLADIGFPAALERVIPSSHTLVTPGLLSPRLPPRSPNSHKGIHGHVLLLAGSRGLVGSALLAARGALRSGAGLITVALPESLAPPMLDALPEAMILPLPETNRGTPGERALVVLLDNLADKKVFALGPGLSRHPETVRLVRGLLPQVPVPTVIDADALNALADDPSVLLDCKSETVITPHPGELGRLLGLTASEVQERRLEVARDFSKKYGVLVTLKGANTVVAVPSGQSYINITGNAGMAAGGMGDVLTGMIAAFISQGRDPLEGALLGVCLHGMAGDLAASRIGPWGYLASEVADLVPSTLPQIAEAAEDEETARGKLRLLVP